MIDKRKTPQKEDTNNQIMKDKRKKKKTPQKQENAKKDKEIMGNRSEKKETEIKRHIRETDNDWRG